MRLILSSIVLAALAANPCFAKDGHAQHSARAGAANAAHDGRSGKGATRANPTGANPAGAKANVSIETEGAVVAPPVLPRGVTQQPMRTINSSSKTPARPVSRATMGATTIPAVRNAIGQSAVPPKNFAGPQPSASPLHGSAAVSPPIIHGAPVATPVSSGAAHVSVANNRGGVNGATVTRPATAPSVIGGPAVARYGINGTAVQNKH